MSSQKLESLKMLSVRELKEKCRESNMRVSGTKSQLLSRLCGMEVEATNTGRKMSVQAVNKWLVKQGLDDADRVSDCLRAGLQRGHIDISGESPLDNTVVEGNCVRCRHEVTITIRELLYQRQSGGDYEDGGEGASVKCDGCHAGIYVTEICSGSPKCDSGKYHNHCTICPGFGKCMGDCRQEHCLSCGKHFYSGISGLPCHVCNRSSNYGYNMFGMF